MLLISKPQHLDMDKTILTATFHFQAKASCSVQKIYDHPCGGSQKLPLYEYVSQRAASAKAQCSKGYKRIQCIAHSYWAPGSQL